MSSHNPPEAPDALAGRLNRKIASLLDSRAAHERQAAVQELYDRLLELDAQAYELETLIGEYYASCAYHGTPPDPAIVALEEPTASQLPVIRHALRKLERLVPALTSTTPTTESPS